MKRIIQFSFVFVVLLAHTGCMQQPQRHAPSWEAMRQTIQKEMPHLDYKSLTTFSHIGAVDTPEGRLQVVFLGWQITSMPAPRGQAEILFFSDDAKLVGRFYSRGVTPVKCDRSYVLLSEETSIGDKYGNALDLSHGIEAMTLVHQMDWDDVLNNYFEDS